MAGSERSPPNLSRQKLTEPDREERLMMRQRGAGYDCGPPLDPHKEIS